MDHLRETLAFGGGSSCTMTSVDTNNAGIKFFFFQKKVFSKNFFATILGVIGLQVQHELLRTSPLRPAREKMVVDPVGWSQGSQNAEKGDNNFLLKKVTFVTKNSAGEKLRSPK